MALDKVRLNGVLNGRINAMGVNGGSSGGGGAMVLTLTVTGAVGTLDATYAQVKAALRAGTEVLFVADIETEGVYRCTLLSCQDGYDGAPNYANFSCSGWDFTAATEDDLLTTHLA